MQGLFAPFCEAPVRPCAPVRLQKTNGEDEMKKLSFILLFISVFASASVAKRAYGLGECGLSCCLAGAAGGGVALAENFGVSLVYENAWMETIREGTGEVSPDDAIARNRQTGMSYKVPLNMRMQKVSLVGAYPVNERLTLLASVPYVINDMEMRNMNAMSMVMDMRMETVSGLGDATLLGLYTLYADAPVRPAHRLTVGLGLKTPTGRSEERTASGSLVHAMMQTGSGSWDPVFMVNYMRGLYPLVLQATLFYQMTTEGVNGYEFGDRFTYDLSAKYQAADYINVGVELNGIHAAKDIDHDGAFSVAAATSMADNPEYTGLTSIFVSPVVQAKLPGTGGSAEFKYQLPLYQDVNGFQQVVDWRALATVTWVF